MAKEIKEVEKIFGVYGIYFNNILLYVGSTDNFLRRKKEHQKKLLDGKHQKTLQKYFNTYINDIDKLEFKLIHATKDYSKIRLFISEMICILNMKPKCNKAVYQMGLKYICFGNPVISFDNEILKYL